MHVTFTKLRKYVSEHGGFELFQADGDVELSFVPSFPEALEKSDSEVQPRVTMKGKLEDDVITFLTVEVEDQKGSRPKGMDEAELTYGSWIAFIEDNY